MVGGSVAADPVPGISAIRSLYQIPIVTDHPPIELILKTDTGEIIFREGVGRPRPSSIGRFKKIIASDESDE
jgi:hypothetical protein